MWDDIGTSSAKTIVTRFGNTSKVVFNPPSLICIVCDTMPFEQDQHNRFSLQWAIEGKVCHQCIDQFNSDYEQVKDDLSLEGYIETIELANKLIK